MSVSTLNLIYIKLRAIMLDLFNTTCISHADVQHTIKLIKVASLFHNQKLQCLLQIQLKPMKAVGNLTACLSTKGVWYCLRYLQCFSSKKMFSRTLSLTQGNHHCIVQIEKK
jgi:hypothetical protein